MRAESMWSSMATTTFTSASPRRSDIQQFVVGTGGKNHYDITTKSPGSKKRIGDRYGVLRLDLLSDGTYTACIRDDRRQRGRQRPQYL